MMKKKKDINAGITMPLKNIIMNQRIKFLKINLMETEDILDAPPIPCINLCLCMDLSVVLSTLLMLNPEPITVVSNHMIFLKLEEEVVNTV